VQEHGGRTAANRDVSASQLEDRHLESGFFAWVASILHTDRIKLGLQCDTIFVEQHMRTLQAEFLGLLARAKIDDIKRMYEGCGVMQIIAFTWPVGCCRYMMMSQFNASARLQDLHQQLKAYVDLHT